ncbi:helix-turn-helix domain-containing protein [Clostridium thermopalmarium]|uniref:Helix-turn-helix protein n=1 Tax=Clostridium thermopalmarium DSM 5974 TaxID=1121340 RepID=A0A2T0ANR5_9CLOT|nr:helix-turn-helix transcriptional regulator [Clostridium thermopalmarium]PRR70602.1 helix-turn-helix protein [Clostridium thermopalmarium DSM 5974]PVZ21668.1 helix-turn-helix protein [Clostridium thermopalmarium DSM 5974]
MLERNIIGKKIKRIRQLKGITQDQLAARLNIQGIEIDQTMISKIEEQVRGISDYEVMAFSVALGVSIEELFDEM